MLLKQIFIIIEKQSFEGKYASFKNIKFSRGNYSYQTDSSETSNTLLIRASKGIIHPDVLSR